jgi:hypothetical protein
MMIATVVVFLKVCKGSQSQFAYVLLAFGFAEGLINVGFFIS